MRMTFLLTCFLLLASTAFAAESLPDHVQGDVGGAIYASTNPAMGTDNTLVAVPYLYFDYGRFFARFDTFGIKTLPMGYGYLEVMGRINLDGYRTDNAVLRGLSRRRDSLPLGIGTFQETPIGGFFLNAFQDAGQSHGQLYELIYAAEFAMGGSTVYPLLGFEHFSRSYTRYYYGVTPTEASRSNFPAYDPKSSTMRMSGFVWDVPVVGDWYAQLYFLRRFLGRAISDSPLVNTRVQDEGFLSLSYRYK